jgi:hypothetical protein
MMVSGTYWPPYGPKRPRATGGVLVRALVIGSYCLQEGSNKTGVFAAAVRELDAAADVDAEG